jgi:type IV pilus assembly protein PilB
MTSLPRAAQLGSRRRLGELLVSEGVLDDGQLAYALENQMVVDGRKERLGQTVVRLGFASEQAVARALATQLNLPYVEESDVVVDEQAAALVPAPLAERHRILPLAREDDTLVVACTDPTDVVALDDVRLASGLRRIRVVVATPSVLNNAIRQSYGFEGRATELLDAITVADAADEWEAEAQVDDGPVVRLAEGILAEALKIGASDVHIEPGSSQTVVRYRVDGVLKQVMTVPRSKSGALLSRLKLMAAMDIAERRRPQDGRAAFRSDGQAVDLRVSSLPSLHGETLVLRLLRKGTERLTIKAVGFTDDNLRTVLSAIERPQGLVLITGPTGSGKTSSLYGFLGHLAGDAHNIITLEDPVEYELAGVNQTQINDRIGFTFARALRTVLRQDPDIVMVGEIRDPETAELALQASLTGHLVLSTLHTNNAPAAVVRLRDLGIPNYLVASSLTMAIAQRLVRTVCTNCAVAVRPGERVLAALHLDARDVEGSTLLAGKGCNVCNGSGYRGRTGVFEILLVDGRVRELLVSGGTEASIRSAARLVGMRSLREDGLRLAKAGRTTLEEVLRVTPADDADSGACPVCAQQVEPEYTLCPWCGVHLRPDACAACEHPLQSGWRVCPRCGTQVPGADAGEPRHVLVVADPDPQTARTVLDLLDGEYDVRAVRSGTEVLDAIRTGRTDALLIGPDLEGMEVAQLVGQLRSRPEHPPVVLLSSGGQGPSELDQRRIGADHVLHKPLTREPLCALLTAVLDQRAA